MPSRLPFLTPLSSLQCRARFISAPRNTAAAATTTAVSTIVAAASFHTSRRLLQEEESKFTNHYAILELQPNATAADIKRQFYALSKLHHPDIVRSHPSPSSGEDAARPSPTRFHQINEAYHVLGSAETRQRYDRDYYRHFSTHQRHQHQRHHPPAHPSGSFSSHSNVHPSYAGSRPASGLSRRRTQFRGPPPSFYQQGMYGNSSVAQDRQANVDADVERAQATAGSAAGVGGGFGPGQPSGVFHEGVPHFDKFAHKRTQEGVASTQSRSRAARRVGFVDSEKFASQGGDLAFNVILMSGVLAFIVVVPLFFLPSDPKAKNEKQRRSD